jgi:RimJ/RimL family protein N-acetyltransferase
MMDIPHLTTERLLLRGFAPEDVEPYVAMMANADVTRYLGDGRPLSRDDAWRQLAMLAGHWVLRGFGLWAVEEQATGRFIGRTTRGARGTRVRAPLRRCASHARR